MKRMLHFGLLLMLPFLLNADHGRRDLNGRWISPYFDTQIRIKVKRNGIRVKGLTSHGWSRFIPIRRNVFKDRLGNIIKFRNIHDLVYINRYRSDRIRFVKRGHNRHNHTCNSRCSVGHDFFSHSDHNYRDNEYYGDGYSESWRNDGFSDFDRGGDDRDRSNSLNNMDGRYLVREIDQYVTINRTRNGLKARRGNGNWVTYTQNRNRKNEYVDVKGNKYLVRSDGSITWKSKDGEVSLNLQR